MTHAPPPLLAAALGYAARGWRVVPLHPHDAATDAGKRPRPKDWPNVATDDADTIAGWWREVPNGNVGVALGSGSGIVGVDVDTEEGSRLLSEMSAGDLPDTCEMTTGKGSRLLYTIPDSLETEPRTVPIKGSDGSEAIRFQGTGAQCVMPPSIHPSGKLYAWVEGRSPDDLPPAPMPGWLIVEMTRPKEAQWVEPQTSGPADRYAPGADYSRRGSWSELLTAHGFTPAGGRGDVRYYTRPGKASGVSATLGHYKAKDGTPALYVFSGSISALPAERCYDLFGAFARLEHQGDFTAAAKALLTKGYGTPPALTGFNGTDAGSPAGESAEQSGPQSGTTIILGFFHERYRPVFKTGNTIHTAGGADVPMSTAVAVPTSALIERLTEAADAPRFATASGGGVKRDGLPGFFRKWAPVAWGDLLQSLPDEDGAALGSGTATAETFRQLVRDALLSPLSLGDVIGHTSATQVERRSVIGWCSKFGVPGPWRSIRDFAVWCKRREQPDGEVVLQVAIRHELFAQLRADRRLTEMTATKWARRATRYGIGSSKESDRPQGRKAVTLDPEFLAELTAGIPDDDPEICPQSEGAAHAPEWGKNSDDRKTTNPL